MLARSFLSVAGVALLASGCAGTDGRLASHLETSPARECVELYRALDAEIDAAGVRDAQHTRVPGFPHLRVDRGLSSLRDRAAASEPAMKAFAERLLELDLESRRFEIRNLPRGALPGMDDEQAREQVLRRTRDCGRRLRDADLASPEGRAALLAAARVPDDYSSAARFFGLYYLTRLPFASGVRRWQEETRAAFAGKTADAELPRVRYTPPAFSPVPYNAAGGLIGRASLDALGEPALSQRELERLAAAYAPSIDLAIGGDFDRFGWLRWRRGVAFPEVDASEPAVYVHSAYTRYRDQLLLQLVYTLWFPERPGGGGFDLLSGRLDGLVWRVTLAPDGEPLIYDSIHPCGCYHLFFPTPRARPRPPPDELEEWAFVPQTLPRVAEGERPVLRIASGTHYLERVGLVSGADSVVRYTFRAYDELRSMPRLTGGHASAFGPDGLIAGSERAERFFFWPMGIASAGAMRQWGRHATAFVGRRHFDDADLLERRFELDL